MRQHGDKEENNTKMGVRKVIKIYQHYTPNKSQCQMLSMKSYQPKKLNRYSDVEVNSVSRQKQHFKGKSRWPHHKHVVKDSQSLKVTLSLYIR